MSLSPPKQNRKRRKLSIYAPILTSTVPDTDRGPDEPHMVGYARVSTPDQNLQRQIDEIVSYGVAAVDIFSDKASGKNMERPGWRACWLDLREGDILVVHSLDRLGRNLEELLRVDRELREKGVTLRVIAQNIDTSTTMGRIMFQMFGMLAEIERSWSNERSMHGLRKARERGIVGGAMKQFSDEQIEKAIIEVGGPLAANAFLLAAKKIGCSKPTAMRRWAAIEAKRRKEAEGQ